MSKHKRTHHDQPVTYRQLLRALARLKQDLTSTIVNATDPK